MADEASAAALRERLRAIRIDTEVLSGVQAACELAALDDVDQVMAAIVGASGLLPTLAAIRAGKTVLLANKESLVTCGRLFMEAVRHHNAQLLPVDSEHNAIFQSLPATIQHQLGYADLRDNGIESIILTGSGGPFRDTDLADLGLPTINIFEVSPWYSSLMTVTSILTISPSFRGRSSLGIPWQTTSFTEMQTDFGKP